MLEFYEEYNISDAPSRVCSACHAKYFENYWLWSRCENTITNYIFHTSVTIFSNNCMILLNIHKLLSILTLKDKNILVEMVCESEHTLHWNSTTLPSNETKYIVINQVMFGILASEMMPIQF